MQCFELYTSKTRKEYVLILFWSADCSHCIETISKLYTWHKQPVVNHKLEIVAISLDETDTEVQEWKKKNLELKNCRHLLAVEGLRSKVAGDYYILGIPVMILLTAETKEIIALPESAEHLDKLISLE